MLARQGLMRAIYFLHIFTGILLIGMLVVVFKMKDVTSGHSGVVSVTRSADSNSAALQPSRAPRDPLTFIDQRGRPVSEEDFYCKFALVFFGYASCPDVCPGNLATMASAMRKLDAVGDWVQPIFISFDPLRDTPEMLQRYVEHFHPRLLGLTGSPEEIAAATRAYGVYYKVSSRDPEDPARFDFEHSSQSYLIDPTGEAVALFRHDSNSTEMAEVIIRKVAEYTEGRQ
jgi:cytochrome oxidase Cu insertion factor (SCO1/SenC/PrrC family)